MKFKETNQICSPLKISESINAKKSTCGRNNKGIYSCFYESKDSSVVSSRESKKTEDGENVFF